MRSPHILPLFVGVWVTLLALTSADPAKIDVGKLDQYKGKVKNAPSLKGETLWVSGKKGDGFDVVLSPDLQGKVEKILKDKCEKPDDKCYQEVRNLLRDSSLEYDSQLNRRGFAQLLSKTFKKLSGVFTNITMVLVAMWEMRDAQPPNIMGDKFIPEEKASSAADVASATEVIVSGTDSAIMTITPTPDPSTLTGSATPDITPITTATDDYSKGDLMITMDENLAKGIGEIIRRSMGCESGDTFSKDKRRKRAADYGAAICGAENVLTMAVPGGAFADFRLIDAPQIPFGPGDVARAAAVVVDFAREYAPLMDVTPEVAAVLGQAAFALAVDVLIDNISLGEKNPIRHSTLSGKITSAPITETQTKSCASASTKSCKAECKEKGMIEDCETTCVPVTGCATATATKDSKGNGIATETISMWTWPTVADAKPTPTAKLIPDCKMDKPAGMQWDIFASSKYSVATKFCKKVEEDPKKGLGMMVDNHGFEIPRLRSRSPPVDPDTYDGYKIGLVWEPRKGLSADSCPKSCEDTFKSIANSPCGHTGGTQNIMAQEGSWDVGCGTYSWNIDKASKPSSPPEERPSDKFSEQSCYTEHNFPGHKDVAAGDVSLAGAQACGYLPKKMTPDSDDFEKTMYGRNGMELNFRVSWEGGCVTDVDEVNAQKPLPDEDYNMCYKLFMDNWKKCNNGGVGGWRSVGCLEYSFSP